jgi:hypothetical protein
MSSSGAIKEADVMAAQARTLKTSLVGRAVRAPFKGPATRWEMQDLRGTIVAVYVADAGDGWVPALRLAVAFPDGSLRDYGLTLVRVLE